MPKFIRLGDPTSHGGKVVTATGHLKIMDVPVARLGDACTCPQPGYNGCVIVEGDSTWLIDAIPVALEGHRTSCGARLMATVTNAERN